MQRYAFRLRFLPMQRSTNRRRFPALFCSHADREVYRPIRRVQIQTVRAIFVALCDIQNVLVVYGTSPRCCRVRGATKPYRHVWRPGDQRRLLRPIRKHKSSSSSSSAVNTRLLLCHRHQWGVRPPSRSSSSSSSSTGRSPVNTPPL